VAPPLVRQLESHIQVTGIQNEYRLPRVQNLEHTDMNVDIIYGTQNHRHLIIRVVHNLKSGSEAFRTTLRTLSSSKDTGSRWDIFDPIKFIQFTIDRS
jgi:hypothetical protein